MKKTNTIFTAMIVVRVTSHAGLAFPEIFDASASSITEHLSLNNGDAQLRIDCSTSYCSRRPITAFRIFVGGAFRDLLELRLGHRFPFDTSRLGGGLSPPNRSMGFNYSPVRNPLSMFGKVTSKYGWTLSDARVPNLPSGKDRGFGLGYGTAINIGLSPTLAFSAEWERHRYEIINEKSNVTLFMIGFSYAF